jgi:hypothetical protein
MNYELNCEDRRLSPAIAVTFRMSGPFPLALPYLCKSEVICVKEAVPSSAVSASSSANEVLLRNESKGYLTDCPNRRYDNRPKSAFSLTATDACGKVSGSCLHDLLTTAQAIPFTNVRSTEC